MIDYTSTYGAATTVTTLVSSAGLKRANAGNVRTVKRLKLCATPEHPPKPNHLQSEYLAPSWSDRPNGTCDVLYNNGSDERVRIEDEEIAREIAHELGQSREQNLVYHTCQVNTAAPSLASLGPYPVSISDSRLTPVKKRLVMGYQPGCPKCRDGVKGHYSHLV
ncbi:hypothetical protein NADFUDRAFT_82886 [Nadsonia fulvescens var. elongata DSM 6958]|uniref:Uncharacterized protein n=1 Tax=Nadsonia fulvescens var. elongata DSM 6958 TaxID=857566 RepID=A0A1E3PKN7_9ASCO|nr:hypothetical protein NADFUDRAFT_82886 [Nadsonia fulvescens var. elongata DSM 6958]